MTARVVVSDNKISDVTVMRDILTEAGYEVDTIVYEDESDLLAAAEDAVGIIPDARTAITERFIEECPALQVVGRGGIGVDNIDLAAAAENDVQIVNVPDYGVDEVSTHALALALACLRKVRSYDRAVRDGSWDWEVGQPIHRLAGSTVGLVAFGKIARRHAKKLQGFDVDVLAADPYVPDYRMADLGVEKVGFDELLSRSDIISVHAPLTDETEGLFDAAAFERMRDTAVLVNTARGPIVEESALADALDSGEIAGAGIDVFETEPASDSVLFERDDVIVTPHVAWYSEAALEDLSRGVAEDVVRVLEGDEPRSPVSLDQAWR